MNFENKQFKLGRLCDRVISQTKHYENLREWINFVNDVIKELSLDINEKILISLIKFYDGHFDEKLFYCSRKIARKNYFLVGEWNENDNHDDIEFDEQLGGIVYLENGKIELLIDENKIKQISKKTHEVLYIN